MIAVKRRVHFGLQQRHRTVLDSRPLLFHHDVSFRQNLGVGEFQIDHAVCFHLHDERQTVLCNDLEIGGEVVVCESVVLAAIAGNDARKLPGRDLRRALEHQMFEEVGEARLSGRFVGSADAIPDHVGHDRRAMIGDRQNLHAVGKTEALQGARYGTVAVAPEPCRRERCNQDKGKSGTKDARREKSGTGQHFTPKGRASRHQPPKRRGVPLVQKMPENQPSFLGVTLGVSPSVTGLPSASFC